MFPFFNEEDLTCLFKKWASDTEKYGVKKAKSEECRKRLEEAEISFIKKQEELFKRKREMDKSAYMTRDEIRRPFREARRRIEKEIYRDFESKP